MKISSRVLTSAAAIVVTCAVTAAAYFYKRRSAETNEVMVFCKLQFNAYGCFDKLMSYVEAAKKSVSVCMPGIHNPAIQGRLVRMMKDRNLKVRIIVDRSGFDPTDFLLRELIELGAEIRFHNELHHLQLKFCLVDDTVLLTGTLNWGNDRSSDHWNYVYITNKNQLVKPVKEKFQQMWNGHSQESQTEHHESDTEDHESHTEDRKNHTEERKRHVVDRESHTEQRESHTENRESNAEDLEIHMEGRESNAVDREDYTAKPESHTTDHESHASQFLNPVTDISESFQENSTFRETVPTPEVYLY